MVEKKKTELETEMEQRKSVTTTLRGEIAQMNSQIESWAQVLYQEQVGISLHH
jgi:peptidoglycan hydrolase CwlO-like protein